MSTSEYIYPLYQSPIDSGEPLEESRVEFPPRAIQRAGHGSQRHGRPAPAAPPPLPPPPSLQPPQPPLLRSRRLSLLSLPPAVDNGPLSSATPTWAAALVGGRRGPRRHDLKDQLRPLVLGGCRWRKWRGAGAPV